MSDYIKRENAIEWFQGMLDHDGSDYDIGVGGCIAAVKRRIPSADVAPIKHGRWDCDMGGAWCSVCGEYSEGEWNYCPNCGAKMDLED